MEVINKENNPNIHKIENDDGSYSVYDGDRLLYKVNPDNTFYVNFLGDMWKFDNGEIVYDSEKGIIYINNYVNDENEKWSYSIDNKSYTTIAYDGKYDGDDKIVFEETTFADGSYSQTMDGITKYFDSDYKLKYLTDGEGNRTYYQDDYGYLIVKKNGNKKYLFNNNTLELNKDGTFAIDGKILNGKYYINEDNIICIDNNGNSYEYSIYGEPIQTKKNDGTIINYSIDKMSAETIRDGKKKYSRINHIEYDEEEYDLLMKKLIDIKDKYPTIISNEYSNITNTINKFDDVYSNTNINNTSRKISEHINEINLLKEKVNYSLLAYDACDKELIDGANKLVDRLFDSDIMGKYFKYDIRNFVSDVNNNQILKYNEKVDFNKIDTVPTSKMVDEKGNIWYFNRLNNLVFADGNDLTIEYGGENFSVSFSKYGYPILKDSNGNPVNIFGEYNDSYTQYGGNQSDFILNAESLLEDNNIMEILEMYFPEATTEEYVAYFNRIAETGCGYVAMTDIAFKKFEGKEDDFYFSFGYPMYNVKNNNSTLEIDYNYEPLILDLYSYITCYDKNARTVKEAAIVGEGTHKYILDHIIKYLESKVPLYTGDSVSYCADYDYDLYYMKDTIASFPIHVPPPKGHAMVETEYIDENYSYVSSWGKKMVWDKTSGDALYQDDSRVIFQDEFGKIDKYTFRKEHNEDVIEVYKLRSKIAREKMEDRKKKNMRATLYNYDSKSRKLFEFQSIIYDLRKGKIN